MRLVGLARGQRTRKCPDPVRPAAVGVALAPDLLRRPRPDRVAVPDPQLVALVVVDQAQAEGQAGPVALLASIDVHAEEVSQDEDMRWRGCGAKVSALACGRPP